MGRKITVRRWLRSAVHRYGATVAGQQVPHRVAPVPRPEGLDRFEGLWVAVLDDEVVAAEATSHSLALKLHDMDHTKRRRVVVEYVRPKSESYIVGVG